jgi:nondiscriminating glutamyl-tRNA synthetase
MHLIGCPMMVHELLSDMRVFRIAPSPTGHLHLGHAKAYLVNYAVCKSVDGEFILRIEDTDKKRNQMDKVDNIILDLGWMGIDYDKGPEIGKKNEYFQSDRLDIYNKYIQELLDNGKAYKAYDTAEERELQIAEQRKKGQAPVYAGYHANLTKEQQDAFEAEGRKPVVRLHVPKDRIVEFQDKIYGKVKVSTNTIGDIVIQKSDGTPMYNFCVVIDDHLMGVTDVVRGFGHLSNTPKQILIYETFGWEAPSFAHFSDLLNEDGQGKLAKRKGAKPISRYKAEGYLPDAIFNYIMVVSCSFAFQNRDQEIMSREEIYSKLKVEKVLKTNARFSAQKLDWFNGQHIRKLSKEEFVQRVIHWLDTDAASNVNFDQTFDSNLLEIFLRNKEILNKSLPLIQERVNKFVDIFQYLKFMIIPPLVSNIDIVPSNHVAHEFDYTAQRLYNTVQNLSTPWDQKEWELAVRTLGDELGWKHGDVFMVLRLLIVGEKFSPPLFEAMAVLGKEECLNRMETYLKVKSK